MLFDFLSDFNKLLVDNSTEKKNLSFVLGNESADLDSIIGSIAYAYLSNHLTNSNQLCLPIIQVSRSDLRIRPECVYVFQDCGFSTDDLIFIDDVTPHIENLFSNYDIQLVLVDHNELIGVWKKFPQNVNVILDHHEEKGLYMSARLRCIESVGSATSLVVLNFREIWERGLESVDPDTENRDDLKPPKMFIWHKNLAKFLLAPILVDTVLLDVSKGKTTDKDQMAADFLLNFFQVSENVDIFIKTYYDKIQLARFNIIHLSNFDLLRKDYKERDIEKYRVGISSIAWNLDAWIERESLGKLTSGLKDYCQMRKLDLLIVMLAFDHKGVKGFRREMIIYSVNGPFCREEVLEEFKVRMMGLVEHEIAGDNIGEIEVKLYDQKNIGLSRKQVYPIVENLFSDRR
ncbi:17263_t:CDS:2 [Acaulospora morrowiae]|uniref:17263_t:CDS:1 n=1 Tax=Acaulospora morrowiae TaxID=94023 RepID=A0A9N8YV68_9GLOM|nr:17263_t:CDS:2 [Acaulospora morrowiae]